MKALVYLIVLLGVLAFGFTFFQYNPQLVTLKYFFGLEVETYLALVVFAAVVVGLLIGWAVSSTSVIKAKTEVRRARKEVRRSERELESIRSLGAGAEDSLV